MKNKLMAVVVMAAGLMAVGVTPADAAGPFCIHLSHACDQIQISTNAATGNIYGYWDVGCNCQFETMVLGRTLTKDKDLSASTFGGLPLNNGRPAIMTVNFVLYHGTNMSDLWLSDGATDYGPAHRSYTATPGTCTCPHAPGGEPLLGRQ